jgi:hypothetical protein
MMGLEHLSLRRSSYGVFTKEVPNVQPKWMSNRMDGYIKFDSESAVELLPVLLIGNSYIVAGTTCCSLASINSFHH